jgi:ribosomal protein L11 methyltransferase
MNYFEINITLSDPEAPDSRDIIAAHLSESEFESFEDTETGLKAFIQEHLYNEGVVYEALDEINAMIPFTREVNFIPEQNWNETWEKNYEPVMIAGQCFIRAPFHAPNPEAKYELIIEPKMSFGTAHHETTSMMIELILEKSWHGKKVLDMGSGTGVLGILASKMGASEIVAIDNDEWAFLNAVENIGRNNTANIEVLQGDDALIENQKFDVIIANINRNILLAQIQNYSKALNPGGEIFLSGFYEQDVPVLLKETEKYHLKLKQKITKNNWVAMIVG